MMFCLLSIENNRIITLTHNIYCFFMRFYLVFEFSCVDLIQGNIFMTSEHTPRYSKTTNNIRGGTKPGLNFSRSCRLKWDTQKNQQNLIAILSIYQNDNFEHLSLVYQFLPLKGAIWNSCFRLMRHPNNRIDCSFSEHISKWQFWALSLYFLCDDLVNQ
jgi:hypothetical protein